MKKELEELRRQVTKEEVAATMKILAKEEKPKVTPVKVAKKRVEAMA